MNTNLSFDALFNPDEMFEVAECCAAMVDAVAQLEHDVSLRIPGWEIGEDVSQQFEDGTLRMSQIAAMYLKEFRMDGCGDDSGGGMEQNATIAIDLMYDWLYLQSREVRTSSNEVMYESVDRCGFDGVGICEMDAAADACVSLAVLARPATLDLLSRGRNVPDG